MTEGDMEEKDRGSMNEEEHKRGIMEANEYTTDQPPPSAVSQAGGQIYSQSSEDREAWQEGGTASADGLGPGNYRADSSPIQIESRSIDRGGRMQEGRDPGLESGSEAGSKENYEIGNKITEPVKSYERGQREKSMETNSPEGNVPEGMTSQQEMGTTGPSGNMQTTGAEGSKMSEGETGSMGSEQSSGQGFGGAERIQEYLRSVNYPIEKQGMLEAARSNNAPEDIMSLMNRLPDKTYNASDEVEEEFKKIQ